MNKEQDIIQSWQANAGNWIRIIETEGIQSRKIATNKAIIENINVVKKSVKKSDTYPQGGYVELEKPISLSNLMLVDKKNNKPTRFATKVLKDGSKERIAKLSGETI